MVIVQAFLIYELPQLQGAISFKEGVLLVWKLLKTKYLTQGNNFIPNFTQNLYQIFTILC